MYPLLLVLANLVKSNHHSLLIWHIFYIQREENGSICIEQRIAFFQCCASEVLLFALQIITYLLIGFGEKKLKEIKMERLFKRQDKEW